jgi:hypothetical protein
VDGKPCEANIDLEADSRYATALCNGSHQREDTFRKAEEVAENFIPIDQDVEEVFLIQMMMGTSDLGYWGLLAQDEQPRFDAYIPLRQQTGRL